MLKTPAFVAGLCLAALATPAAADPYDDFLQLCVASGGDVAAAEAGARAAGFGDAPLAVSRAYRLEDFPQSTALTRSAGTATEVFIVGTAPRADFDGMTGTTCIVLAPGLDPASVETRLTEKLNFPPFDDGPADAPMWYLSGGPDVWRSEPQLAGSTDDQIAEVARLRPVSIFAIVPGGDFTALMYGTLK
ncbi:hypothetical protein [Brevundimonas sp.]|uniref:hypothetical protein n=1 Tax=Brevundimonas sp. TaxID=1871086 RepID=UPI00261E1E2D|nr:hypothetical protein [Brevundimonas sp.]